MSNVKLCSLWLRKSKSGIEYYSGKLGGVYVNFFFNDRKRPNSQDPDASIMLAQIERQQQPRQGKPQQAPSQRRPPPRNYAQSTPPEPEFGDPGPQEEFAPSVDELPF